MSVYQRYPAHHSRTMQPLQRTGDAPPNMLGMWGSRDYFAVLYAEPGGHGRLTINSTTLDSRTRRWKDGLTWDELMAVKRECGFGDFWCVEVYPPDDQVVNVAAMRHLWLLDEAPPFAWTDQREEGSKV